MSLSDLPLGDFVAGLLSSEADYGGGSAAALAGSLAAGLIVMVGRATVQGGTEGGEEAVWAEVLGEAELLSRRLLAGVDEDAQAYDTVVVALRMPMASEAERRVREAGLRGALVGAARVPHCTLLDCARILELAASVAGVVKTSLLSDLGAAASLALAGARTAALNVEVNARCLPEDRVLGSLVASCREGLASAETTHASFARTLAERGTDAEGYWKGWLPPPFDSRRALE